MQGCNSLVARARVWPIRLAALALIVGSTLLRLVYLVYDCPLDLAPDEAHYWHWSQRLDWSYYSKGPLVALLIRTSCWLFGTLSEQLMGSQMVAVRLPALACGALLLTGIYVLATQFLRREKAALLVIAVGLTMPVVAAGSLLMTIDAPYTCCWIWGLVFVYRALFCQSSWSWWAAGACVAVGILAKYTMVLFAPMVLLCLLTTPALRAHLRRPAFWGFLALGALGGVPILIWNAQHDWLTVKHALVSHARLQGEQAGRIHWLGPFAYLGGQFGFLLGYWFVIWCCAMIAHHPLRERRPEHRFLWFMAFPMFLFFGLFSLKNGGGEPNWPITAYLSGMVLAAGWLLDHLQTTTTGRRRVALAFMTAVILLGLAATTLVHRSTLAWPVLARLAGPPSEQNKTPLRRLDPTCRLRGWRELALHLDLVRTALRQQGIEPVLAGVVWTLPGEIGFYCQDHPTVYSVGAGLGDRHSQYDLWLPNPVSDPAPFLGRTFIMVGGQAANFEKAFARVEPTREICHRERGQPVATWTITVCHGYRGFDSDGLLQRPH